MSVESVWVVAWNSPCFMSQGRESWDEKRGRVKLEGSAQACLKFKMRFVAVLLLGVAVCSAELLAPVATATATRQSSRASAGPGRKALPKAPGVAACAVKRSSKTQADPTLATTLGADKPEYRKEGAVAAPVAEPALMEMSQPQPHSSGWEPRREAAAPRAEALPSEPLVGRRLFAEDRQDAPVEGGRVKVGVAVTAISPEMLPNPPADIDLDCELEDKPCQALDFEVCEDVGRLSMCEGASEAAAAAAEGARQAAQRGMLVLSATWSLCMEQARQAATACRLDKVESCIRHLPQAAASLVPPSPMKRGLQTLVSESASLWAGALWKILMLQVLVIIKTVVSQGNVIARSFIQAACLEPTAMVPDTPMLQRQRSRAKALAAVAKAEQARARMQELKAQMAETVETLRWAEQATSSHSQHNNQGKCARWSESDYLQSVAGPGAARASWRGVEELEEQTQHGGVSFQQSSGSLSRSASLIAPHAPRTPGHCMTSTPSQALLMSASRRTPLPASPLPPPTATRFQRQPTVE